MVWKNPWYDPALSHHTPEGFCNPEPDLQQNGDLKRWRQQRKEQRLPLAPAQGYAQFIDQWGQSADLSGSDDVIWWLGHACLLLRIAGRYTLLTRRFPPPPPALLRCVSMALNGKHHHRCQFPTSRRWIAY